MSVLCSRQEYGISLLSGLLCCLVLNQLLRGREKFGKITNSTDYSNYLTNVTLNPPVGTWLMYLPVQVTKAPYKLNRVKQ